jgi:hypothetical protein
MVVVLVAAGGGIYWFRSSKAAAAGQVVLQAELCPGLHDTLHDIQGKGFHLVRQRQSNEPDSCIGWTIDRNYPFGSTDSDVKAVIKDIVAENVAVAKQPTPYVRIALMMPMVATSHSGMQQGPILHALQGAYVAQLEANANDGNFGDAGLDVQLVLANDGPEQNLWKDVVTDFRSMANDKSHPLVAVTGLGVSVTQTRNAAVQLGKPPMPLPTIGAVLTGDDMTTREVSPAPVPPSLFKVSFSNYQYVQALKDQLDAQKRHQVGFLVFDGNSGDDYAQSLAAAFRNAFPDILPPSNEFKFAGSTTPHPGAVSGQFDGAAQQISGDGTTALFYAGRDIDLTTLVRNLETRSTTRGILAPIIIVTGMTGLVINV